MRVLVSGGGTAGHIYPALTVARHAASVERSHVAFVGVPDSLEARLSSEAGIEFIGVPAKGWDRARPLSLIAAAGTSVVSFMRCMRILRTRRIDVVIGFGGYVSLPLGLAAAFAGVPLVLHEQNAVPGLANRLLSRWAHTTCVTYAASIPRLANAHRTLVTGDPVREEFHTADRQRGRQAMSVRKTETMLLVFGGSRGARHLNTAMVDLYPRLKEVKKLQVVHIAGPTEAATVREALAAIAGGKLPGWWRVLEYSDQMADLLAAADLVVCRAGATTLAELAATGRPAVLVPYPYATDDHQSRNAEPLVESGAAEVVSDSALDTPAFGDTLVRLLADAPHRQAMGEAASHLAHPFAAEAVADVAQEAAASRSPWRHHPPRPEPEPAAEPAVPAQPAVASAVPEPEVPTESATEPAVPEPEVPAAPEPEPEPEPAVPAEPAKPEPEPEPEVPAESATDAVAAEPASHPGSDKDAS